MTKKQTPSAPPSAPEDSAQAPASAPAPAPTPEEIEHWKGEAAKAADHWDKLLRTTADLENFKKRAARERLDAEAAAQVRLLAKFITVLDNFEMALAAAAATKEAAAQSLQAGVQMIAQQFRGILAECGLEEIDALGKMFDPNFHEAVSQQDSVDVPEGQVIQQLRKGYRLRERLLRPASVVVARRPASVEGGANRPA